MTKNQTRLAFSVLLAFLTFLPAAGFGQYQIVITLNADNDGTEDVDKMLKMFGDAANFRLHGQLLDIERACELSDEQSKKLKVAAKGAATKFVGKEEEKAMQTLRQYQARAGFDIDDEDDGGEDEDEDEDEAPPVIRNFAFVLNLQNVHLVKNEPIWRNAVARVLTNKQHKEYEQASLDRKRFFEDAAVDHFVAQLENSLYLSAEQREKIRPVIHANFADDLVNSMKNVSQNRGQVLRIQQVQPDPEHVDLVKEILSEKQLEEWIRSVEPELKRLSGLPRR